MKELLSLKLFKRTKIKNKLQRAFTLAEVISVVAILGIVAAITIPSTISRSSEGANRVKVKKAMAVYDKALSQYYLTDNYSNFASEYSTAYVLDPNGEREGLTGDELTAKNNELRAARTGRINNLNNKYSTIFSNYFNIRERVPNSNNEVFVTKDGVMWYPVPGTVSSRSNKNTNFLEAYIVVDKKLIKDLTAQANEGQDIRTQIKSVAEDLKDNRAFKFIAERPSYAVTPVTNPIHGIDYNNYNIMNLFDKTTNEIDVIQKMYKLYGYLNSIETKKFLDADRICTDSTSCCGNNDDVCIRLKAGKEFWSERDYHSATKYQNGTKKEYILLDETSGEIISKTDYDKKEIKITYRGNNICFSPYNDEVNMDYCGSVIIHDILQDIDNGKDTNFYSHSYNRTNCIFRRKSSCD